MVMRIKYIVNALILTVLLGTLFTVTVFSSCHYLIQEKKPMLPPGTIGQTSTVTGGSIEYPDEWPITEVSPPVGSTAYPICLSSVSEGDDAFKSYKKDALIWILGFNNELDWNSNVKFFDSLLIDKLEFRDDGQRADPPDKRGSVLKTKHYLSKDGLYRIQIHYTKRKSNGFSDKDRMYYSHLPYEGYELMILKNE